MRFVVVWRVRSLLFSALGGRAPAAGGCEEEEEEEESGGALFEEERPLED